MFYVEVSFDHTFSFNTTASKTMAQVAKDIIAEAKRRSKSILLIFNLISILSGFLFIWMVLRVIHYRNQFIRNDRFDNFYINKQFVKVDEQRKKMGKESLLPLTRKERGKYVRVMILNRIRLLYSNIAYV